MKCMLVQDLNTGFRQLLFPGTFDVWCKMLVEQMQKVLLLLGWTWSLFFEGHCQCGCY